jgi:nicotinamidase-related amidase
MIIASDKSTNHKELMVMKKALLVIDIQNDYFPEGSHPLWNTEEALNRIVTAIENAQNHDIAVIHIQHVADNSSGIAPFLDKGTEGVKIHNSIVAEVPDAPFLLSDYMNCRLRNGTNL